jgi:ribosomal protein S18 acetylase RimI-like enzyme
MAYATRTMTRDQVALAIGWAAQEGWNPGLHDAVSFHAADPSGFFVGSLDGQPIASLSVVKYGHFAFLGLYIVLPEFRGQGFGWALWQHGMSSAAGRQVGLDGVVAQQANYRKSGFALAWRNVRYEGRGLGDIPVDARIADVRTLPFDALSAYDQPFFPADRKAFLRNWIAQPDAAAFGFIENDALRGFGVARRCLHGWKIGPLFADTEAAAEALFVALAGRAAAHERVYLDVPEPNAAAVALARRQGMRMVFETARMYTGAAPKLPMGRMYGVTTFELG